jgi:hypothetical protein
LLKLGLPVTYDNPDISLMRNGVLADENDLLPNTDYEINATIWNNSYEAPVVGLNVNFSFLSFGASTVDNPIGTAIINLGVKGGPNHPALAKMIWKTPPVPGHFCLQVLLNWVDDANPENNLGQNNVDIVSPHSPATSTFKLRNNTKKENRYRFETDTYTLPASKTCEPKKTSGQPILLSKRLPQILAVHNKANFLIPAGWLVEIVPATVSLLPDQEMDITVNITPPTNFTGKMPFNINAIDAQQHYAGGVTIWVVKN